MAYIPASGSVVAFQSNTDDLKASVSGTVAVSNFPATQSSIVAVQQGSVATVIIGGSLVASFTPPANQSVSGTVGASVIGLTPVGLNVGGNPVTTANPVPVQPPASGSLPVTVVGSVGTVIIGGSIAASFTPPVNQSVSGTVHVDNFSSVVAYQLAGSVMAVSGSFTAPANQSVSGTVQVDVLGSVATVIIGGSIATTTGNSSVQVLNFPANQSVSGAVSVSNLPTTQNVSGSVVAFQGGKRSTSISGTLQVSSTVQVLGVGSVGGADSVNMPPVLLGGVAHGAQPSVVGNNTYQKAWIGVNGQLQVGLIGVANSGAGSDNHSQLSFLSASGAASSFPWGTAGYVFNGTNWDRQKGNSSIGALVSTASSSVITIIQANSIAGTYAEDTAHTTGDRGLFTLGVRNDTLASVASADSDYTIHAVDSAGRMLVKPFASEDATIISYKGSVVSGSVTLIQASAIGKRNYITDFWVANTGATTALVTFQGGDTSVVGYTIAPTGGGSNSPGIAIPLKTTLSQDLAFKVAPSSSVIYLTVKGYQAP